MHDIIFEKIAAIESLLKELKESILQPKDVEILVILNSDRAYIHLWDGKNCYPRVLFEHFVERSDEANEHVVATCRRAIDMLPRTCTSFDWRSDLPWEKLGEKYAKLDQVYSVNKLEVDDARRKTFLNL